MDYIFDYHRPHIIECALKATFHPCDFALQSLFNFFCVGAARTIVERLCRLKICQNIIHSRISLIFFVLRRCIILCSWTLVIWSFAKNCRLHLRICLIVRRACLLVLLRFFDICTTIKVAHFCQILTKIGQILFTGLLICLSLRLNLSWLIVLLTF